MYFCFNIVYYCSFLLFVDCLFKLMLITAVIPYFSYVFASVFVCALALTSFCFNVVYYCYFLLCIDCLFILMLITVAIQCFSYVFGIRYRCALALMYFC